MRNKSGTLEARQAGTASGIFLCRDTNKMLMPDGKQRQRPCASVLQCVCTISASGQAGVCRDCGPHKVLLSSKLAQLLVKNLFCNSRAQATLSAGKSGYQKWMGGWMDGHSTESENYPACQVKADLKLEVCCCCCFFS